MNEETNIESDQTAIKQFEEIAKDLKMMLEIDFLYIR